MTKSLKRIGISMLRTELEGWPVLRPGGTFLVIDDAINSVEAVVADQNTSTTSSDFCNQRCPLPPRSTFATRMFSCSHPGIVQDGQMEALRRRPGSYHLSG